MKLSPYRISIAAGLGWLAHGPCRAGLPFRVGEPWPEAVQADILAACAVVLAVIAGALLWRHHVLRGALLDAQDRLAAEQALRAGAESALLETHANLCKLAAAQDQLLLAERRRIAADIHDDLGQNLLTLKMDLSALHAAAGLPAWLKRHLALVAAHVDVTVRSLRVVINCLRPIALEQGLRCAVERQLEEFSRISGVAHQLETARYTVADTADANAEAAECAVFRVLQEALSNVMRHAQASEVKVALCRSGRQLRLSVQDNGVGLAPDLERCGHGLPGIEERVKAAGGCYSLQSEPGRGTLLRIVIPALPEAGTADAKRAGATATDFVEDQAAA